MTSKRPEHMYLILNTNNTVCGENWTFMGPSNFINQEI
jgi:hypothetical protein